MPAGPQILSGAEAGWGRGGVGHLCPPLGSVVRKARVEALGCEPMPASITTSLEVVIASFCIQALPLMNEMAEALGWEETEQIES